MTDNDDAIKVSGKEEAVAHLAAIIDSSDDAILSRTLEGTITSWNRGAERLYGYCAQEAVGRHISLLIPEDRMGELQQFNDSIGKGGRIKNYETVRITKDRREVHVSLTLSPIFGADGLMGEISIIARDNSDRIRMERLLRESETRYRVLVEMAPDAFFVHQYDRFVYANCSALGLFGVSSLELLQQHTIYDLAHPEDRKPMRESIRQLLAGGDESLFEYRIVRVNGEELSVESSSSLIDYQGKPSIQVIARDITQRKKSERERDEMLKELDYQRKRFETVVRQLPVGVLIAEAPSGRIVYQNEESLLICRSELGKVESIADYRNWEAYRPDGSPLPVEEFPLVRALQRGETVIGDEMKIRRGDGTLGYVLVNAIPIKSVSGEIVSGLAAFSDITRSKEAEEALRRSALRFRRMADAMPQMVWSAEADGSIDYVNAHFESYTGITRETITGLPEPIKILPDIIHPDDVESTAKEWLRAIDTGESYEHENRIKNRAGAYRWHLSRANAERDEQGQVVKWYGTATDIHDLRETQEKLQASETRFRWLYESNLVAIFFWGRNGRITDANQAYCDLVGYSAEECRDGNLDWIELSAPECHERDLAAIAEIISSGISKTYEKVFINRKNGKRVAVLTAIAKSAEEPAEGIGYAVDLTELKRAEEALRNSEATLKLAIETTGLGIFVLDLVSGKGEWSAIAKRHYGLSPDGEIDLETALRAVHPEDRPRMERIAREAASPGGAEIFSAQYRTIGVEDGKLRWLIMRGRVSYDDDGAPRRLVGACLNVTDSVIAQEALKDEMTERLRAGEELRRQEQLLIRQGRLAAMGEMIANIAHQWRQPLNTLALIVQEFPTFYQRDLLTREYLEASVARAMQVINYMSQTIDGFRNFFGPDKEKQTFLASEVLERTVAILDAAFAELKLELVVQADREAVVYGTPNEYSQVILNILMNAKDALLERKVPNPRVDVRLFREEGRAVLTITDNAGGIPAEIFDKIFDPYFTTKGPDKGTGIGLFMSKTIIEKNMNGRLTVANTDQGAQFRIEV